ncbi:MAG: arginine--tRNA ligase [Clostridia bacterium]|nr:arginine--tRNA ligase [Clostridia bacterium]
MNNLKQNLEHCLQEIEPSATLSVSEKSDFQCNSAFSLAKQLHKSPIAIANEIADKWNQQYTNLATATAVNGFINLTISDQELTTMAEYVTNNHLLPLAKQAPRTVFFDYGGANIAKELHIGHLRSPIIGEALKRVFQAFGHRTIAGAYLGDWGLQMGLVLASIIEQEIDVHDVTLPMLGEIYPQASKRKNTDKEFYDRAASITAKLQNMEEPYYSMCQVLRNLSVSQVKKNYEKLNCTFDIYDGESTYQPNVEKVIGILQNKNMIEKSQGALIVNVAQESDQKPMPPVIVKKQNGGDLYATSDISAIYTRYQQYKPNQFVYITDARQALHFEQIFRVARLAELVPNSTILTHIGYGTINGKDGKPFKTRDGGTIKLEDILDTVAGATTEFAVGLSAIKFADLINQVHKDYIFDLQKCISFEGKTGPYILYTIVRINAIFNKAGSFHCNFGNLSKYMTDSIRKVIISVLKLTESYNVALNTLSLNAIAEAIYNLANAFTAFYTEQNIIHEADKDKQELYLSIAQLTKTALEIGLDTLAIDTVQKM